MKKIAGNKYLKRIENQIIIDSIPFEKILELSKTPFLVFLENRIRDNIKNFNETFTSVFKTYRGFYSFKANYLPEICRIIQSEGLGAEILGLPELNLALKLQFPPEKIILGGPYLPDNLIEKAIKSNVKEIIIYHLDDLKRVNMVAQNYNKIQNVCLRINSQKFASKLGIDCESLKPEYLKKFLKCKNIKITTLLSHYTTQMNNFKQFEHNIDAIALAYHKLTQLFQIENINLGGGFPEAVVMPKPQLRRIAERISDALILNDIKFKNIYFEPGRYFVGDSGLFIAKIIQITDNRWIFLDIGNHICPKFSRSSLRFYNASRIGEAHDVKTSIAGIIPTDQDVFVKDYFFSRNIRKGDIVLIPNVGAYTLTFSNRFPYPLPNIYMVNKDKVSKIFDSAIQKDFSLNIG